MDGNGYSSLHNAPDDHSRLAYSEILSDEKETAVEFWQRAQTFFASNGITVQRVLTAPCSTNGPTPSPTPARQNAATPTHDG